ncbi:AAA family ATPase [Hymenobacter sp. B81]|uniref:AAA family ATPase n=1 Tax=Hymenobacter sp. B81 TaxID=3344878 RepID=UPI0037DCDCEE
MRWNVGLVVGKFAPLHRGHQYLIEQAAARVRELHVWVYSNPEPYGMPAAVRAGWLRQLYAGPDGPPRIGRTRLHVRALGPDGSTPPPNAADDYTHREFVRRELAARELRVDVVFSSEAYGPGFAQHLGAAHVSIDAARLAFPVSGSRIRAGVYEQMAWLHPLVAAHFRSARYVQRVVLLGAESSGKSTLTAALGREFGTSWVAEYGRTRYEEKGGALAFDDMLHIARRHRELEDEALARARHFLFVDTNALTTVLYAYAYFGRCAPELRALALDCRERYAHTFVCAPDFAFEQDGTRAPAAVQPWHHGAVLVQLDLLGIPYTLLTGPLAERLAQVRAALPNPAAGLQLSW